MFSLYDIGCWRNIFIGSYSQKLAVIHYMQYMEKEKIVLAKK